MDFFLQLEWYSCEQFQTSFIELAYIFWDSGFRFEVACSPAAVATLLRKCVNQASKLNLCLVPGKVTPKAKSNGKTFSAGIIQSGFPICQVKTLKKIAVEFFNGKTKALKDWKFPF